MQITIIRHSAVAAAIALALAATPAVAETAARSGNPIFDRATDLVEENFYAKEKLPAFRDAVAVMIANVPDVGAGDPAVLGDAIDFVLASLDVSHTGRFAPEELAYYELVDVFRYGLRERIRQIFPPDGDVTYAGIGIASVADGDRVFITDVYDGGPADRAGLLVGDEILAVDDEPFAEIGSFRNKAGRSAAVSIRRTADGAPFDISVPVEKLSPADTFVSAIAGSAEVIEHDGYGIGYLRLWAYTERAVEGVIEEALTGPLAEADGLVLDLRSRWGGAPGDAADTFVGGSPEMTMVFRDDKIDLIHARWRKPIVAIIDEGTRSGMEILAYALKENGVTLIGEPTAADVLAGRAFWLPDGSLLEIAVADVFVDGGRLEDVGVQPDIAVPFDFRHAAGADPQRDAAIEELSRHLATGFPGPRTP
ncbi:S41 family peptidase [Bauldia litoralis]|uniref:PDZ domain-containing protein n=1 Tax=Bauldia litoralis TaxID=665467 RepID=A0A1G6AIQ4_9HYPH|nr:S41 family peptidase [Bauldia litoralis]SDB08033.1 PDZ domain-containing protein [Bauldia litoralis]